MSNKLVTPISVAIGLAFAGSTVAAHADSLFALNDLGTGYALVGEEGKCGEGKCGEGKCGSHSDDDLASIDTDGDGRISPEEWQAAGNSAEQWAELDSDGDGFISAEEWAAHKDAEGKCGEGKCGEGKCGEGRCGGSH